LIVSAEAEVAESTADELDAFAPVQQPIETADYLRPFTFRSDRRAI
jgi:hypothetical protein